MELRNSFDDAIAQKDGVIDSLRNRLKELRDESDKKEEEALAKYHEKDLVISQLKTSVQNIEVQRDWLKSELDQVINEKNMIGGVIRNQFENISSGLREDVELAWQQRSEYERQFQLHRLELEKSVNEQKDELVSLKNDINEKKNQIKEKDSLIDELRSRLEKVSEILSKEKYYENLESRLSAVVQDNNHLNDIRQTLEQELAKSKATNDNLNLHCQVLEEEKNQLRLTSDEKVEEVLVQKAEYCQELRRTFDDVMQEKEKIIEEMVRKNKYFEEERDEKCSNLKQEYECKLSDVEISYQEKVKQLENKLDNLIIERKSSTRHLVLSAEKDKIEQLSTLQAEFNALLNAKDEKIRDIQSQLSALDREAQRNQEKIEYMQANLNKQVENNESLKVGLSEAQEISEQLKRNVASEIEKVIISKGKHLRELRNEFENVFSDKNTVIDSMRETLKSLRSELASKNESLRDVNENYRKLEQSAITMETEKLEYEAKVTLLVDNVERLKEDMESNKQKSVEQNDIVAQLMEENSRLRTLNQILEEQTKTEKLKTEKINSVKENLNMYVDTNDNSNKDQELLRQLKSIDELLSNVKSLSKDLTVLEKVSVLIRWAEADSSQNSFSGHTNNLDSKLKNTTNIQVTPKSKENYIKSLEKEIQALQKEVITLATTKADVDSQVREKYEDILGNLRVDLDQSLAGYKALQEENFALKNQLDVFRNVDAKRLKASITTEPTKSNMLDLPRPAPTQIDVSIGKYIHESVLEDPFDGTPIRNDLRLEFIDSANTIGENTGEQSLALLGTPVEECTQTAIDTLQQTSDNTTATSAEHEKELNSLKTANIKLKKLCRKYKSERQENLSENKDLQSQRDALMKELKTSQERNKEMKFEYENQFKNLREEINNVVAGKDSLAENLKMRNAEMLEKKSKDVIDLTNMYENRYVEVLRKQEENQKELLESTRLCEDKDKTIRRLNDEIAKYKTTLEHAYDEKISLKEDLYKTSQVNTENETKVNELRNEVIKLSEELDNLHRVTEGLERQLQPKDTASIETDNPKFDEEELIVYRRVLLDFENKFDQANGRLDQMVNERKQKEDVYEREKTELYLKFQSIEEQCEKLKQEKFSCESTLKALRDEMAKLVLEKEAVVQEWRDKVRDLFQLKELSESNLSVEINQISKELVQSQAEVSNLTRDIVVKEENLKTVEQEKEKLHETIEQINIKMKDEKKQRESSEITVQTEQLNRLALQREISELTKINETLSLNLVAKDEALRGLKMASKESEKTYYREQRFNALLQQENISLKVEKEELEGRLRREINEAWQEMVEQNNKLRIESFKKEKLLQELRRELGSIIREKEFLSSAMKGQLAVGEQKGGDIEHLKFKIQQLLREKDESVVTFENLTAELERKLNETLREEAQMELRMATLRAMLEQEVKDHEKAKFIKEQVLHSQNADYEKIRGGVVELRDNLDDLKKQVADELYAMGKSNEKILMEAATALIQVVALAPPLGQFEEQRKDFQLEARSFAEARLQGVFTVIEEMGLLDELQVTVLKGIFEVKILRSLNTALSGGFYYLSFHYHVSLSNYQVNCLANCASQLTNPKCHH